MRPTAVLFLVVLLCAGCRSDGGIGRKDSEQSFAFSTKAVADQTSRDAQATWTTITTLPAAIARDTRDSLRNLDETYHLYLEAHAVR